MGGDNGRKERGGGELQEIGGLRRREPASRRWAERIEFCQKTRHPFHRPEAVSCHLKHFLCNSPDDFLPLCRLFHCSSTTLCSPVEIRREAECWDAGIFTIGNIKDY